MDTLHMLLIEKPVCFVNGSKTLRGILHAPAESCGAGVVFLHGWPGNRIGPHRMFVNCARQLAMKGFHCLRFDFCGRGESDGNAASATIESMIADCKTAVDFMLTGTGIKKVTLLGICSGGKVAVGEASADDRISNLVLWSAEALGPLRLPAARKNKMLDALKKYAVKLASLETWIKILTLRVNTRMVKKAVLTNETPDQQELRNESRMLNQFKSFKGETLFIFGGNDPDTKFAASGYAEFCSTHGLKSAFHEIPEANHSFYSAEWEKQVVDMTIEWMIGRKV